MPREPAPLPSPFPAAPFRSSSSAETEEAGRVLGLRLQPGAVVSLRGPLGCGKTVFVKGLARALGSPDPVTSPTFVIVQPYEGRIPLYHLDLYRLRDESELEDIGFREILDSGGVVAIEWGEKAGRFLPARRIQVTFVIAPDRTRQITIEELP